MGSGTWDAGTYDRITRSKIATGSTFSYTSDAFRSGVLKPHDTLNVLDKDGHALERESRDSDEHPDSTPIIIGFDVTGSMGRNPALIQESLKQLFGMLVRRDIVPDPQVAIGAYGDAYCDEVPLQFGQFESDNRIDDELDNVLIEGGGGGNNGETSTLLAYYVGNHVHTDAWEKRNKKGYLFLIGDERALDLKASQLVKYVGEPQASSVTAEDVFKKIREQWNTYVLLVDNYAAQAQGSRDQYGELLGDPQHVVPIKDGSLAAATIASIIGAVEETTDYKTLSTDLTEAGFSKDVALAATEATAIVYGDDASGDRTPVTVDSGYGELAL